MFGGLADDTIVQVDTVLVVAVVASVLGRTVVDAVKPVDLSVGVTVADGLVKAAGFPSLSISGLIGTVAEVAAVPALFGRGSGRLVSGFCDGEGGGGGG